MATVVSGGAAGSLASAEITKDAMRLCLIFVSFLRNPATHPLATYPIAATKGVSVALDSMGAPYEPPNSLNNRDAANVQLPDDDYDLSVS